VRPKKILIHYPVGLILRCEFKQLVAKRKKRFGPYISKLLLGMAVAAAAGYYLIGYLTRPPEIYYPGFGITIPSGYALHGIDVSKYQDLINWKAVRNMRANDVKIDFVFIKATEGVGNIDNQFRRNWEQAQQQNICKGAYHFFIAGKNGKRQAQNFIELVDLKKGDLPPVLDIEETYGVPADELKREIGDWLTTVKNYYGVLPIIYTNTTFYNTYLQQDFGNYPLWIAHYLQPVRPSIGHPWVFWQHSKSGRVNGVQNRVDFDVFSGDSLQFRDLLLP